MRTFDVSRFITRPSFFSVDARSNKRIKASFRCPPSYKMDFKSSHCLLPISVGQLSHDTQSPHERAKFEATIELINKNEFNKCTILVDDDIQLDTYKIIYNDKSYYELHKIVLGIGDDWINRHEHFYKKLAIPYELKRWHDVTSDPDFPDAVKKIQSKYRSNEAYRKSFDENINVFLSRLAKRGFIFDQETAFELCWNYLIKENAGMGFIWPKWGADFEIYPSGRNSSMATTYEYFIEKNYPNLLKPVSLRFKKYNILEVAGDKDSSIDSPLEDQGMVIKSG